MKRWLGLALLWLMSTTALAAPYPPGCIQAITFGVPINGQLTTSDCYYSLDMFPQDLFYTDIYTFSGVAGQLIAISMTSPSFDAELFLRNVNDLAAAPVAHDDDGGEALNARIPAGSGWFTLPTTGTYYISAESFNSNTLGTGPYTITLTTASAPVGLDLNQHGLTGSWYEPATSGQGFEVEVFPNQSAPGTGFIQVSWFTYDPVAGGAERQRWYTLSGQVVTGQGDAALTIYRNVGGNFNALPVTTAQVVGTATLTFDTCSSGQLSYSFTDGTGRTGTIPLTRLTQNVTCSTTSARPTNADFALSGNWYDPVTSGQGLTIEVNPTSRTVFAAWYTYAPNGAGAGAAGQRWYTAQPSTFVPGSRSIPVTLYQTTGGQFDTATAPGQTTVAVGNGVLTFQSCSAANFSYNFTAGSSSGASGTINLRRVGPVPNGC